MPDLDEALIFYRDKLGHKLAWRKGSESAGLKMGMSDTEIVLVAGEHAMETDLLVESTDEAVREFQKAGGRTVEGPFDIPIGRCAVIQDPWRNRLVVLDMSKGPLKTDTNGNVIESTS